MAASSERPISARAEAGFTLLELVIVLVAVVLVLGSVLVGTAIASQARLRTLVTDHAGGAAAIRMYQDRYAALPGDDPRAAGRWANARNGTGDGIISGRYDDIPPADPATMSVDATTGETRLFWWHLRLAGLIPGATSGQGAITAPTNSTVGRVGVEAGYMGFTGLVMWIDGVPERLASGLERQLDDERADSGTVRALSRAPDDSAAPVANGRYHETGTNVCVMCMSLDGSVSAVATETEDGKSNRRRNGHGNGNGSGNGNGNGNANGNGNGNGNGTKRELTKRSA
ncbi:MAG TPA: hypothetical protein VLD36_04525 [Burkholderiales bacterium]|nr:hypothetical protein [Burkholderiales bacterium]